MAILETKSVSKLTLVLLTGFSLFFGVAMALFGRNDRLGTAQDGPVALAVREKTQDGPIFKWGTPSSAYSVLGDFVVAYDGRTRNAAWTLEHLTRRSYQGLGERNKSHFVEADGIPLEYRSTLEDYVGSGFDRGHLAPADAHRGTQELMDQSFNLINISPQNPSFNRGPWRRIELYCKDMLDREDVPELWAITVPLYLPRTPEPQGKPDTDVVQYRTIGPNHVAVPTHFAKCMMAEFRGKPYCWSYCLPNETLDLREAWAQQYRIDVDFVEHWSGLDLWPALPDDVEAVIEKSETQ